MEDFIDMTPGNQYIISALNKMVDFDLEKLIIIK